MGEKFGRDSIWETHLANELWETDIELDAVLDQLVISLNDVVNWKPGSQMMLNAVPTSPIELRCGEIPLFVGSMGQKGGNMAVKVDKKTFLDIRSDGLVTDKGPLQAGFVTDTGKES